MAVVRRLHIANVRFFDVEVFFLFVSGPRKLAAHEFVSGGTGPPRRGFLFFDRASLQLQQQVEKASALFVAVSKNQKGYQSCWPK